MTYKLSDATVERIAGVCHEVDRALRKAFGDDGQPPWKDAPPWQRDGAVSGVRAALADPDRKPSASHHDWYLHKEREGWKYGPVKDDKAKTHPCMVPFKELPPGHQAKHYVFLAVVRALAGPPG
jgi:hypothetical protein